jgi:photosystem II stability/assembly factor-like uncharacterized protein
MNKFKLVARIGVFALILGLGTSSALIVGETKGLALADLSRVPVRALAATAHGDVFYVALDGGRQRAGIYRSVDSGNTWQRMGSGPGAAINALVTHPTNNTLLYAGTTGGPATTTDSLWLSPDGGRTWHKSKLGLPIAPDGLLPDVSALAVDPQQPGVLYVGTDGHGVYRFDFELSRYGYELMGGVSLYRAHVNSLVVGPEGRVYALTNDGLFVADDNTWQQLSLPEMAASVAVAPAVASDDVPTLYAGSVSTGIYRSTDGGGTWTPVNNGMGIVPGVALRVTALAVDDGNPGRVIAATSYGVGTRFAPDGIYESTDGGHNWTRLAGAEDVVAQFTLNQGVIYATTQGGLARYGEPGTPSSRSVAFPRLQSLANPNGGQVLILALTVSLAALALVGRTEWVLYRKAQAAKS